MSVLSDYLLERLASGDLPRAEAESLRGRLALEPDGEERLARLVASNNEILTAHPPAPMAEQIRRLLDGVDVGAGVAVGNMQNRAHPRGPRPRLWLSLGAPAVLATAFGLILVIRGQRPGLHENPTVVSADRPSESGDRLKGLRPALRVFRKAAEGVERLSDGATARAGDELQLVYVAAGHKFGAVLSSDGAGYVTFHLPAVAGPAVRLKTDGETALPAAYELDAAPGFERFVFVVGDEPFDASKLADLARGLTPPPRGLQAFFFTARKP
jgi:hypothetical protein